MVKKAESALQKSSTVFSSRPVTRALIGAFIGFLAASVLYSRYLPQWVPGILATHPVLFYAVFICVCFLLGLNWGYTDLPDPRESGSTKRSFPLNRILTGLFSGFLLAAVLYTKYMPSWVPVFVMEYPWIFFIFLTVLGGLVSFFWSRTE
ncbi:MAG TPA: hypothetical protein PLV45_13725 [bacterium]|nr:hypothetical protein [bacterium]